MPLFDQKFYANSDEIYQSFQDDSDKKGSPKTYNSSGNSNRNQFFLTVRQERHQHHNHHLHSNNGHIFPVRGLSNNRISRAIERNQKVQAKLLQRQKEEITKSTHQSIFTKYQKVCRQMAELQNAECKNQTLHKQLLQSEDVENTLVVISKLFVQITKREEAEALEMCIKHQQKKRNIRRKKQQGQQAVVNHGNKRGRKKMVKNQIKMQAPNLSSAFQIIKEPNPVIRENLALLSNKIEQKS